MDDIESAYNGFYFARYLSKENNWDIVFSNRVIIEYKRFMYLLSISKNEVTPSYQVDQAWCLHMIYTRSYWVDLCKNTLGFSLHHNSTKGDDNENARFFTPIVISCKE